MRLFGMGFLRQLTQHLSTPVSPSTGSRRELFSNLCNSAGNMFVMLPWKRRSGSLDTAFLQLRVKHFVLIRIMPLVASTDTCISRYV